MRRSRSLALFCGLSLALWAAEARGADSIPGQKPLILVEGVFQYVKGSWASYAITDLVKNESHRMWISVLDQTTQKKAGKRIPHRWMEIEVEMEGQPPVVTRILAEETKEGPGDPERVIIQIKGKSAFSVPQSFFRGDKGPPEAKVAQFQPAQAVRRLERKEFSHAGRAFEAWTLEALDSSGKPLRAVVSEQLPPIGVYSAESAEVRMQLTNWGMGAKSKIRGPVYPFWVWLAAETARESSK